MVTYLGLSIMKSISEILEVNYEILEEDRRKDAIAIKRKPLLVTCTRLEVEAHHQRRTIDIVAVNR